MPSGKTHDKIAFISVIPIYFVGVNLLNYPFKLAIIYCVSCFLSQVILSPDLDIKSVQHKRWGILKWLWFPYRVIFKHRSKYSHGIFTGSFFRIIYLISVFSFLYFLLCFLIEYNYGLNVAPFFIKTFKSVFFKDLIYYMPVIIGITTGTLIHTITDKIFSFFKDLL